MRTRIKPIFVLFALLLLLVVAIFIDKAGTDKSTFLAKYSPIPTQTIVYLNSDKVEMLINEYRESNGMSTLSRLEALCDIAVIRLRDSKLDWSHDGFFTMASSNKYWGFSRVGENLGKDHVDERHLVDTWLNSLKHKENLDYPYAYSCVKCGEGYCVQIFAR